MCEKRCPCTYVGSHEEFLEKVFVGVGESWDGDESAESLVIDYIRELERRVLAFGGSLERWPADEDEPPVVPGGES